VPPLSPIAAYVKRRLENVKVFQAWEILRKHQPQCIVLPYKPHDLFWNKSVDRAGCPEPKRDTCGTYGKTPESKDYRLHALVYIFKCMLS